MKETNTSHLAGEFLVAGELARRGYPVSITMGNAKSVDIYADSKAGPIKVDAKAGRTRSNWPVNEHSIKPDVFYVFVYLGTEKQWKNGEPPEYYVISGSEILAQRLVTNWKTRSGILYTDLKDFKNQWGILPSPKMSLGHE